MLIRINNIRLAYQSLLRQKRRTILTMLAISIGISAVITIMAAGRGMQKFVLGQFDIFDAKSLSIETKIPTSKANSSDSAIAQASGVVITTLRDKDIEDVSKHPNISVAYGMVIGQEIASYNGYNQKTTIWGEGAGAAEVEVLKFSEGRFYAKDEEDSLASVVVLGAKVKETLFGDESAVGKNIYLSGKSFRVIGVLAPRGAAFIFDLDTVIYMPCKTMQKKLLGIDYVRQIIANLRDTNKAAETVDDLAAIIRENHSITNPDRDDFMINTTADALKSLKTVTDGVTLLLVALVCISLLVGGVGIMNIMYVSVAERTFEIGLRKSLGAKKSDILLQFLSEAVLVTLGGGVVGIIIGSVLAYVIYYLAVRFGFKWVFDVSLFSILLSVGFSAVIGLLFGIYPARKASNLSPIDALRKE
ncbi:MAG: ABC transporter permease [Patescibacteria group bacterium]|jgi:putative ABC transport system permease protein